MNREELVRYFQKKRCTVIGLGVSNRPLIDFLLSLGASVTARDQKTRERLGTLADELEAKGVSLFLGDAYLDGIEADLIFRSPGLRPDTPELATAVKRGAVMTSEMELFLELTPATVLGITGSDGKTTTTTLTGLFLEEECKRRKSGKVFVGGNIGHPLLSSVFEMTASDFAVLELSSFQLQTVRHSPTLSAVTNVTENHLNWHTGMEEYIEAKTNIFRHAPTHTLVTNAENEITRALGNTFEGKLTLFSSKKQARAEFEVPDSVDLVYEKSGTILYDNGECHPVLDTARILVPGRHNVENFMTAIALTRSFVSPESVRAVADRFTGVSHRLERVRVLDGVTYYNSSIDSTPARTAAALSALKERPIVICGGYDKLVSFDPLAAALCERAKAVILTGDTAQKIKNALNARPEVRAGLLPIYEAPLFADAVHLSREIAKQGDTVLLSPACASFDAFNDFAERGDTFRRLVNEF